MFDGFDVAPDTRRHTGHARPHRFNQRIRKPFASRWQTENVAGSQKSRNVLGRAIEKNIMRDAQFADQFVQLSKMNWVVIVAHDHKQRCWVTFANVCGRTEKYIDTLHPSNISDGQNNFLEI